VIYLVWPCAIAVEQPGLVASLFKERSNGAQSVVVHKVPEHASIVIPVWVSVVANWAVQEFFTGACSSDGSIEVAANDGGGICWAFAYNST
jgi:hypothetical protein